MKLNDMPQRLPDPAEAEAEAVTVTVRPLTDADGPAPWQILVVDDDPGAIQALGRMLGGCGRLRYATSGADALRIARELTPDLVLLDAEMPGMDGFEVCRAFKADALLARVPVIFVTSHREAAFEAAALALGAADFISKPPLAEQVLARVHARLRPAVCTPRATASGQQPAPARVLLVDGDACALQLQQLTLAPVADELLLAHSGAQALELMLRLPPDLVLLAQQMPGLDGFDVCRRMRADPVLREVPVMVIGARADWRAEAHAFELGASDFVARPYTPEVLQARVRNLLQRTRQPAQAPPGPGPHPCPCPGWHRLADARVAELVASASDALISTDADGTVVLVNAAACRVLGLDAGQMLGLPIHALRDIGAGALHPASTWQAGEGAARVTTIRLHDAQES